MLDALRRSAQSWVMKGILIILALTFVVFFGTTDFGGGRDANTAIEVGEVTYTIQEVGREFNDRVQQLSARVGSRVDTQRAIQAGLLDETISQMATRALFDQAANDLGIVATTETAASAIRDLPRFQGPDGRFDRQAFELYLRSAGLSEAEFVARAQNDLLRAQYVGTFNAALAPAAPITDAIYARRGERRVAEVAIVPIDQASPVADPDESTLSAYFEDSKEQFRLPEFRKLTVARLTPELLAEEIGVSDEDIRTAYDRRLSEFTTPERRTVVQANFDTEADARRVLQMTGEGREFAAAVEEVSGSEPVDLGAVSRREIALPALADAAFSTGVGETSAPVESPLGWHLVHVTDRTAEAVQPIDEVRDELRRSIALDQAQDRMFEVLNGVEDALAGGAPLEDAAQANNLKIATVDAVSRNGFGADGAPVESEALSDDLLRAAYEAQVGDAAQVIETEDGGFAVLRVDEATEARVPALDEVRGRVVEAWKSEQRAIAAEAEAKQIAERARQGGSLEAVAAEAGATFRTTEPFDRTGQQSDVPRPLIAPLFEAKEGDIVEVSADDGAAVAKLVEIREADRNAPEREEMGEQIAVQMRDDLLTQLANALQREHPVEVRREAVERAYSTR